jgi:uncharacterized radical SAM superfamily Fe-S cluster-containing enzyme
MRLATNGDIKRAKERSVLYKYTKQDIINKAAQKSKKQIHNEKVNELKNKPMIKGQLLKIIELSNQLNIDKIHIDENIITAYEATQLINKLKSNLSVDKK